jgi:glycosyltransferase involved in cell wall biosynthesis
MLEQITPLILTLNEGPNIARSLARLSWAREIVLVDSFSSDDTLAQAATFPSVRVMQRHFDSHAQQWNFGLHQTGIVTPWVLALDADFFLTDALLRELGSLRPANDIGGYQARFIYCVNGRPLRGSAYPPVTVLYRRECASYWQDGHTQHIAHSGELARLDAPLLHDDRKPLSQWIAAQARYMRLEAEKLRSLSSSELSLADKVRRLRIVAPPAMLLYCLFAKGAIFDGRAGLYYALQRTAAELVLSLYMIEADLFGTRP